MKYFENAFRGENQWWKYFLMFLIAFIGGQFIGGIPLLIYIVVKSTIKGETVEFNPENSSDLSALGIGSNLGLVFIMLSFIGGLVMFFLMFRSIHKRSVKTILSDTEKFRIKRFLLAFVIWFLLCGIYLSIDHSISPDNYECKLDLKSFIPLILISFFLIPLQAAFEEIIFRGYFAQGVAIWTKNKWLVLIIPSILFSLMHSINPEIEEFGFFTMMPNYLIFGIIFGLCVILDGGIEIAIGAHAANNVFSSIFVTHKSSVLQTSALFEQKTVDMQKELIILLIISFVFLVVLTYIYKWDFKILNKKIIAPFTENS